MAEYLIQDTTLTGIADAIRGKTGGTGPVAVSDMAAQIGGIEVGGDIDALIDGSISGEINVGVDSVRAYGLRDCNNVTIIKLPNATTIGNSAFASCNNLTEVYAPAVDKILSGTFENCTSLVSVTLSRVTAIASRSFYGCTSLRMMDFQKLTRIADSSVFASCSVFEALILRKEAVVSLGNKSSFTNTPIASGTGYIYVPTALIEDYKVATNWSTYAAQFRALEDYTVDGTVTGELDPAKTGT